MADIEIRTPLADDVVRSLRAGDKVLITGKIYTGRDAAHKRLFELVKEGKPLPFDVRGQIMYYVGPSPAKPGQVIGSAGPTTSVRMDPYTPALLAEGMKGMIGKGTRAPAVKEAIVKHTAVYFAAVGGAAALISRSITGNRLVAYEDLGPEAIRELEVVRFPVVVINDCHGNDLYEEGTKKYAIV